MMQESSVRIEDLIRSACEYMPEADTVLLEKAHGFAERAHKGQRRVSGQPYLSHPLAVAKILTELRMDIPALCGGLLHDVMDNGGVDEAALTEIFGNEIAGLAAGVYRTSLISLQSKRQRRLESYRKILLAMSKDVRILLIKLSDRLHNMRTLSFLNEEQQLRISQETLAIYAPLANRLGIAWMRSELEDLSFRYLNNDLFEEIQRGVARRVKAKSEGIEKVTGILKGRLSEEHIPAEIWGRVKHIFSIYRKMQAQGISLDEVFDLLAIRLVVGDEKECYHVLGIVHSMWAPVPGRFKDYIAKPKVNRYRSLHTTVVGPTGDAVEIQIRSREMHYEAEQGVAAHWMYKEKVGFDKQDEESFLRLRNLLGTLQELSKPKEFFDAVEQDLFPDQVYVLTPRGEAKELPRGATPIDFAYKVHTQIGHQCTGARVNGKLVPLKYELRNGDVVEIITSKQQTPKKDWLKIVKTQDARSRIRAWIRNEEKEQAQSLGREILERGLRKAGLRYAKLIQEGKFKSVLRLRKLKSMEDLLAHVAYGKISVVQVIESLPGVQDEDLDRQDGDKALDKLVGKTKKRSDTGIKVRGIPNILVRFARCCNPVHGEEVVGFITRGKGVTVHSRSCLKIRNEAAQTGKERWIDVQWDEAATILQRAKIRVVSQDRQGLLAGISRAIEAVDVNISRAEVWGKGKEQGVAHFEIMVRNLEHIKEVMQSIEKVKGVVSVERLVA